MILHFTPLTFVTVVFFVVVVVFLAVGLVVAFEGFGVAVGLGVESVVRDCFM